MSDEIVAGKPRLRERVSEAIELGPVEHVPRVRVPERVPVVLGQQELRLLLDRLAGVPRLAVTLLYGAGLRLTECLELRVKDIDFERGG